MHLDAPIHNGARWPFVLEPVGPAICSQFQQCYFGSAISVTHQSSLPPVDKCLQGSGLWWAMVSSINDLALCFLKEWIPLQYRWRAVYNHLVKLHFSCIRECIGYSCGVVVKNSPGRRGFQIMADDVIITEGINYYLMNYIQGLHWWWLWYKLNSSCEIGPEYFRTPLMKNNIDSGNGLVLSGNKP